LPTARRFTCSLIASVSSATDSSGREMILSCGAVLDHLRVAIAAAGWDTTIARFPDPTQPDYVAAVEFGPLPIVGDTQRARADAIHRRRTDRLPFAAPRGWATLESTLRGLVDGEVVMLDVVPDDARPQLADASRLTESLRRQDPINPNYAGGHRLSSLIRVSRRPLECPHRKPAA
jgi:hypothetical protein